MGIYTEGSGNEVGIGLQMTWLSCQGFVKLASKQCIE